MNVQLTDKIGFGKYSGRYTYGELLRIDPAYLVWLRQQKYDQGHQLFFSADFHGPLDDAIRADRSLQRKFKTSEQLAGQSNVKAAVAAVADKVRTPHPEVEPEIAYPDGWGAF